MIKEERRRARRRKRIIIGILIFLAISAVAVVVVIKGFRIQTVEVQGNKLYPAEVIENAVLNDEYSWNSLYVYFKYRFVDTRDVPFVDTMEIALKSPGKIQITVYEKGMMGYLYVKNLKKNAYFDKDGFVVEISSDRIADTPQIKGLTCEDVVLYEKLPVEEALLKELLTLTQTLKRSGMIPDSITYGVKNEPVLKYDKVQVEMGDLNLLTQKVERLDRIMPSLEGASGTLHLENWSEETTSIIFDKGE